MARAMMKVQMDHALTRLREAFDNILGPRPTQPPRNADQIGRAKLVASGKVKITPAMLKRAISRQAARAHDNWCESIEDSISKELELELDKAYKPVPNPASALYSARHKKLSVKYQEAKDEIILGDVERALTLIAQFAKIKV